MDPKFEKSQSYSSGKAYLYILSGRTIKHTEKLTLLAFVSPKRIEILVHERKFGGEIFQREIKIHSSGFVRLVPASRNLFT